MAKSLVFPLVSLGFLAVIHASPHAKLINSRMFSKGWWLALPDRTPSRQEHFPTQDKNPWARIDIVLTDCSWRDLSENEMDLFE
ncbi:hypothetical protein BDV06DRAFT_166566 [Aspergillus oleicola]